MIDRDIPRRISIGALMGLVLVAALGIAALRDSTPVALNLTIAATSCVLLFAPLGILYRGGFRRAFWVGFAIFGWAYMIAAGGPGSDRALKRRLPTDGAIEALFRVMHPLPPDFASFDGANNILVFDPNPSTTKTIVWGPNPEPEFFEIGHALAALLCGFLGSLAACFAHATRERPGPVSP